MTEKSNIRLMNYKLMNINQEASTQSRDTGSSPLLMKFGEEIVSQYPSQNDGNFQLK